MLTSMERTLLVFVLAVSCAVSVDGSNLTGQPPGPSSGHGLWLQPGISSDHLPAAESISPRPAGVTVGPVTGCTVRIAYIIPSNRTAQSNAVSKLSWAIRLYQDWYREQMERSGFGPKTFRYETEPDGTTPKVYTVNVAQTDDYLRGDLWGRTISAASAAGIPVWTARQVWWLIPEAHLQSAAGQVSGGTALGASFGSGDDAGVAMIGGDALARFTPEYLTNNSTYAGRIIPEIGPYPLVQDVSFPWFEGSTLSSVASSVLGAGIHEMSHAFGQPHDFRNDNNFNGNLMGNGLRGIRGNFYPERYRSDYTRAAFGSALALSVSRYFNPPRAYTDNTKPSLTVATKGTNAPVEGLLQIGFTVSDASPLRSASLQLNGDLVDEMPLYGKSTNTAFLTASYTPGQTNNYTVSVFDEQGNKQTADTAIFVRPGYNRAPQPTLTLSSATVLVGQSVTLNASASTDPGGSSGGMQVEWDLDGDLVFDTPPTTVKSLAYRFDSPGDRLIRARLTDTAGAKTVSTPLPLRINAPALAILSTGNMVQISWASAASGFVLQSSSLGSLIDWSTNTAAPALKSDKFVLTITNLVGSEIYRLKLLSGPE